MFFLVVKKYYKIWLVLLEHLSDPNRCDQFFKILVWIDISRSRLLAGLDAVGSSKLRLLLANSSSKYYSLLYESCSILIQAS